VVCFEYFNHNPLFFKDFEAHNIFSSFVFYILRAEGRGGCLILISKPIPV